MNMQDFYTGRAFDAYEFFGAHTYFGGTHFALWAPSAQHIAVETEAGTFDIGDDAAPRRPQHHHRYAQGLQR